MRAVTSALVLAALAAAPAWAQTPGGVFSSPSPNTGPRVIGNATPYPADLREIAAGMYECRIVRTRARLDPLQEPYYLAADGADRVVVIPMPDLLHEMHHFVGRRVEVVGMVRELKNRPSITRDERGNPTGGQFIHLCPDQDLPATPGLEGREAWPRMSITVTTIVDDTPVDGPRGRGEGVPSGQLAGMLAAPTLDPKQSVTIVGRFCGVQLCGGLTTPAPTREAWVLQDGEAAVWVVGRGPEGKGFRLDPAYAGDTKRWLEVKGKLEPCGAARCLRAQRVALAPRPADAAVE